MKRTEQQVLANLLELYSHELSVYFPITMGADGRFGYRHLPLYFEAQADTPTRWPYFITLEEKLAGFALATRGSPASVDPRHLDVAEFFVLRQYRGLGVGEQAAALLWDTLPGRWWVRVALVNEPAAAFWGRAVERYTGGAPQLSAMEYKGMAWQVYTLASRGG